MANKKISQLTERTELVSTDVIPVVASGAIETNKTLLSTLLAWIQTNLIGKFNTPTGTTSQYIRGDGTLATLPDSNPGTVTSIGVSVPSAFNISGSPVTSAGTITISGAGNTTQYVAGDGSLVTFPVAGQSGALVREVRNTTGATLAKGTVVYINGANGNKPTVAKAQANSESTSARTFGLLQSAIANNSNGYCVVIGDLSGLDTSAFTEGVQLYLSGTVAGEYTSTKTLAPTHLVYIGKITRSHPTQGQIEVGIQNGYELDELHDVAIVSKANNEGIFYDSATSLWKNKTIETILGFTPATNARSIATTSPLLGGGDLSANRTFSIQQATTSQAGYLSSTDWSTFNGKQNLLTNPVTGIGFLSSLAYWTSSNQIGYLNTTTYPSLIELAYVKGVTSAIQTQLNGKQATLTNPITGTGTTGYLPKFTGTTAQGNSPIYANGTNVSLGSTSLPYPFYVATQVDNISIYAVYDIVAFSDESIKENIRPIDNALDRVIKSRGVLYDRIDNGSKNNIGFIAQELELQFPELVVENEDGTKAVKYQNAVAVLFEAVKEQQKQIDDLKELVNKLIAK